MKIKNYIWDFDGTLFDTYPVMLDALEQTIAKHGIQYDGDLAYFIKKYSIRQFALDYATPDFMADYHALETKLQTDVKFYPVIPAILANIVENGGRNFVVSHRDDKTYDYLGGLSPLFTEIITSDNHLARKPDPEAITYLIDKYDLEPSQTAMVGDRPLDIEAGQNAGVKTILFDEAGIFGDNALNADLLIQTWQTLSELEFANTPAWPKR
ncbi:HAD family hydrolase [Pseudolactococcus yaeyamensis]